MGCTVITPADKYKSCEMRIATCGLSPEKQAVVQQCYLLYRQIPTDSYTIAMQAVSTETMVIIVIQAFRQVEAMLQQQQAGAQYQMPQQQAQ